MKIQFTPAAVTQEKLTKKEILMTHRFLLWIPHVKNFLAFIPTREANQSGE